MRLSAAVFDGLNFDDGNDTLTRNVVKKLSFHAARNPEIAQIAMRKFFKYRVRNLFCEGDCRKPFKSGCNLFVFLECLKVNIADL